MRLLLNALAVLATLWVLVSLGAYLLQDRLLFYPQPVSPSVRKRLADLQVRFERDGVELHGWLFRRPGAEGLPFLVYYGGNGEEVSWNFPGFAELPLSGFLLMNYRGYGDNEGRPSADVLKADALFLLDELLKRKGLSPEQVVLMGRSLGSGVAVHVASQRKVGALLLVTPFDRLSSLASHHYPILPVRWLLRHRMDSVDLAPKLSVASLVILAGEDRVVPPQYGRRLHDALGGPKELLMIPGADHNDIEGFKEYWPAIENFLKSIVDSAGRN